MGKLTRRCYICIIWCRCSGALGGSAATTEYFRVGGGGSSGFLKIGDGVDALPGTSACFDPSAGAAPGATSAYFAPK